MTSRFKPPASWCYLTLRPINRCKIALIQNINITSVTVTDRRRSSGSWLLTPPTEVLKPTRMVAFFGMSTELGVSYQGRNKEQGTFHLKQEQIRVGWEWFTMTSCMICRSTAHQISGRQIKENGMGM
jgi:hypothetical protein